MGRVRNETLACCNPWDRNPFAMPHGADNSRVRFVDRATGITGTVNLGRGERDDSSMFRLRIHPDDQEMAMEQCCEIITGLAMANLVWMRRHQGELPCCLPCGGVTYVPPQKCTPKGACQDLYDASEILKNKRCTCADGVAYEVAAQALAGNPSRVVVIPQYDESGTPIPNRYHAVMEDQQGNVTDVSAELTQAAQVGGCGCKKRGRG